MGKKFQTVRGMHDVLPDDEGRWFKIHNIFYDEVRRSGFHYIETPILEDASLYTEKGTSGEDILEEMYSLKDKSGNLLAMRPEGTAAVVRAYLEHGMGSLPKPVKLYYAGPMFRYDRPQAGRYRQHHQLGVETFGDARPQMDAQLIALAYRTLKNIGLLDVSIQINSIGDDVCRPKYIRALVEYYKQADIKTCGKCKVRLKKNPLRMLDCKEKVCIDSRAGAPHLVDYLDKDCHDHFKSVLEFLDEMSVPYELNPYLVRGFDYYNRTTFEIWPLNVTGEQIALGGGGRYDGLVEALGGKATPALGFSLGVERLLLFMKADFEKPTSVNVFIAQLGEKAQKTCLRLYSRVLDEGIQAEGCFDKENIRAQLKTASDLGAKYTLIIGQKEVFDGTAILRDMESGNQENFPQEKIISELKKRLLQRAL